MEEIKVNQTDEVVYKEVLANGLTVYLYPNSKGKVYNMNLTTKFGSIHTKFKYKDDDKIYTIPCGLAHFLEHITFHLDGMEANELFQPYGAYINAFTSHEKTSYVVNGVEGFDKCLDNLLYYVYTNYYTEETVENEKNIIKEEAKRRLDNVDAYFYEAKMKALFSKANYRNKVLGEIEDIESITLEDITTAYNMFYQPANMILVIVGNFDKDEALKIINQRMDTFTFNNREFEIIEDEEPAKVNEEYHDEVGKGLKDKVSYTIKTPIKKLDELGLSREEYLSILSVVLRVNFGGTSLYYEELIDKGITNNKPSAYCFKMGDFIIISITGVTKKGKIDEFIDVTDRYINNLLIDQGEIDRKIKCSINNFIVSFDNPDNVLDDIIDDVLDTGRYINDYLDIIKNITVEKAKKVMKCIDFDNKSIVIIRKKEDN